MDSRRLATAIDPAEGLAGPSGSPSAGHPGRADGPQEQCPPSLRFSLFLQHHRLPFHPQAHPPLSHTCASRYPKQSQAPPYGCSTELRMCGAVRAVSSDPPRRERWQTQASGDSCRWSANCHPQLESNPAQEGADFPATYHLPPTVLCGYMDDGFDHAVTVIGDQVESLFGFGQGEMVCHKLIDVYGAA